MEKLLDAVESLVETSRAYAGRYDSMYGQTGLILLADEIMRQVESLKNLRLGIEYASRGWKRVEQVEQTLDLEHMLNDLSYMFDCHPDCRDTIRECIRLLLTPEERRIDTE